MYFILFQDNYGHTTIMGDTASEDQAKTLLTKTALEFIKEEDGLKKAKTAFVDAITNDMTNGHYLVLEPDELTITLFKKSSIEQHGYFGSTYIPHIICLGYYYTVQYEPSERVSANVCPRCNERSELANATHRYSMDRNGQYSAVIADLRNSPLFHKMREMTELCFSDD